jgi:hypothetical protein
LFTWNSIMDNLSSRSVCSIGSVIAGLPRSRDNPNPGRDQALEPRGTQEANA